jgi:3-methylfumaryl-CoA hydratase
MNGNSNEWSEYIGRSVSQEDILTPAMLTRFNATIDSSFTGDVAAQAIHWCLCTPEANTLQLGEDGHPRRSDNPESFLPPIPLPRRMWASSQVQFHAPISVGAAIERTSSIASIIQKSGSSGPLVFVDIRHVTNADGKPAVTETQTIVYREVSTAPPTPLGKGSADLTGWQWHREIMPSEALLFRYSALTFNSHRIHYDTPYAVNEEQYRGLVVHGPLTATLLLDLAQRELGVNTLKSFAFRGQSPAFVGETLHLVGRQDAGDIKLVALGSDGRIVMSANASI